MAELTPKQRAHREWRTAVITANREGVALHFPWREKFENFLKDMGEPPARAKLRRRNAGGSFSPSNCYWATP